MKFTKYHGAGNDFVMIDGRAGWPFDPNDQYLIESLCHRRFGIGADGLIVLTGHELLDFDMSYYNSDGKTSSLCGNGGRCIVAFAAELGITPQSKDGHYRFMAIDGKHRAKLLPTGLVSLEMLPVDRVETLENDFVLETGSPHYVSRVEDVDQVDIISAAHQVRYNDRFAAEGINVNFIAQKSEDELIIRTYERGVEDETYACGTGVVAAAIVQARQAGPGTYETTIHAKGGTLSVKLSWDGERASEIWLRGGAERVYSGDW
ncbi:MAG: diaminopimelate epimerase [Bacteroidota bacterium]